MSTQTILDNYKNNQKDAIERSYSMAKLATYSYEVSIEGEDEKIVSVNGGQLRLTGLENAYQSLVDVGDVEGAIEQVDGTFVTCTLAEWENLLKAIRAKGRELYGKRVSLKLQINALTIENTFDEVYSIVW